MMLNATDCQPLGVTFLSGRNCDFSIGEDQTARPPSEAKRGGDRFAKVPVADVEAKHWPVQYSEGCQHPPNTPP
jgi:hypothetical protein